MVRVLAFLCVLLLPGAIELTVSAGPQQDAKRAIISDDFTKARPRPKKRRNSAGHSTKSPRRYHLASKPLERFDVNGLQVGITIWKLQRKVGFSNSEKRPQIELIATRVEADTQFNSGDLMRISIESPRAGYLYVIDRDWFSDGTSGYTNLIFPLRGDDNRLYPGRLIDIPAQDQTPFTAKPTLNQTGELLTFILTSAPLALPISGEPLRISEGQLLEWTRRWNSLSERFEMNDGTGQTRTIQEQQAGARKAMRQLTRDDPAPQTIYLVTPSTRDGLLFNLLLSYVQ